LTFREALRSRALLAMAVVMCLAGAATLMWPVDIERDHVILVQQFCYRMLMLFGLISAAFMAASTLPRDIASKRIYSLATKPISRLEMLLGKTLGLLGVMAAFVLVGYIVTSTVTHIASARKTYAGGSYTLEVTDERAEVRTDGDPVPVKRGQVLTADGDTDDGYKVTIAGRDKSVSGVIPKTAVELHERDLTVLRVAEPEDVSVACTGVARVELGELLLLADALARDNVWSFNLSELKIPAGEGDVHVRMRFDGLLYETRYNRQYHQPPTIRFEFSNPDLSRTLTHDIDFTYPGRETRPVPNKGKAATYYEQVFALPRALVRGSTLEARIIDHFPVYAKAGRTLYRTTKTPTWHIRGFSASDLPEGRQTLRLKFLVLYTRGLDVVDHTNATIVVTNPETGEWESHPVQLRHKTVTYVHFPRRLIDDGKGVDVTLRDPGRRHRVGHMSKDSPMHLILAPDWFWASTARSSLLIFLLLSKFTVLAVAASTFLSAPVAILLTLATAFFGLVKDVLVASRNLPGLPDIALVRTAHIPLILSILIVAVPVVALAWAVWRRGKARHALGVLALLALAALVLVSFTPYVVEATQQTDAALKGQVAKWGVYVLTKIIIDLGPGFDAYSSSHYVTRGWTVPWAFTGEGAVSSAAFVALCFGFGYMMFARREFE